MTESDARLLEPGVTVVLNAGGSVSPRAAAILQEKQVTVVREAADPPPVVPSVSAKTASIWSRATVGVVLVLLVLWALRRFGSSSDTNAITRAAPVEPPAQSIGLTISDAGLEIENRTNGPLGNCLIQIAAGYVARVPMIPAHESAFRSYLVLFDSEDREREAAMAGKTFTAFVFDSAKTRTVVSCEDSTGHRVAAAFH